MLPNHYLVLARISIWRALRFYALHIGSSIWSASRLLNALEPNRQQKEAPSVASPVAAVENGPADKLNKRPAPSMNIAPFYMRLKFSAQNFGILLIDVDFFKIQ